ncbi:hypothetical protein AVEN_180111-1 [Araneus ventricosus]|uniref:Histone-lysine N-methyltransferase SETMAR n=1 Tax=Araneus ventricosus TaxID=182803 RepID=A0A4Y2K4G2_ARAVE|nr:hypothetical protein AVEN_180111-1 [Araneus ventricosus]
MVLVVLQRLCKFAEASERFRWQIVQKGGLACATLIGLRKTIRCKRPRMLSNGVIFLHNNARPHIARKTQELLQNFRWEIWSHHHSILPKFGTQ